MAGRSLHRRAATTRSRERTRPPRLHPRSDDRAAAAEAARYMALYCGRRSRPRARHSRSTAEEPPVGLGAAAHRLLEPVGPTTRSPRSRAARAASKEQVGEQIDQMRRTSPLALAFKSVPASADSPVSRQAIDGIGPEMVRASLPVHPPVDQRKHGHRPAQPRRMQPWRSAARSAWPTFRALDQAGNAASAGFNVAEFGVASRLARSDGEAAWSPVADRRVGPSPQRVVMTAARCTRMCNAACHNDACVRRVLAERAFDGGHRLVGTADHRAKLAPS